MQPPASDAFFLQQLKDMYQTAGLPCCFLDRDFNLLWYNEAAKRIFPLLSTAEGIQAVLKGYDHEEIRKLITSAGRFSLTGDFDSLFSSPNILIYAAPPNCGDIYIFQPQEFVDTNPGALYPQGFTQSIMTFESNGRTHLSSMFSLLSLLRQKSGQNPPNKAQLLKIADMLGCESMAVLRTIQLMTDYTRLSKGLYPVHFQRLDLYAYLDTLFKLADESLQSAGIPLEWELPNYNLFTVTDPNLIHIIFCHLLSNACRFGRPNNQIHISVQDEKNQVIILLKDQGIGIRPDIADHVFEPYFSRGYDGAPFSGIGLGLSIAQECTAYLDGELTFTSTVNQGSTFRLTFPIRNMGEDPLLVRSPENCDLHTTMRLLLCDSIPVPNP